jgi:hypothetical protein
MGDAGAGSLRKRYLIARFQQAFTSTHFFDLDRFYGAIFGTTRLQSEQLPINPFTDIATGEEWDTIHASDARFRERVFALAKAIPLGATKPGLKTAAEAIVGAPCEVLEDWDRIDYLHGHGYLTAEDFQGHTWAEISREGTYDQVVSHGSWSQVSGVTTTSLHVARQYRDFPQDHLGSYAQVAAAPNWAWLETRTIDLGQAANDRGGVLVRPLKAYAPTDAGNSEKAQDEQALRRVLNVLKPAGVRLHLDMTADGLYATRPIAAAYADSEYFEIIQSVSPSNSTQAPIYPVSQGQRRQGITATSARALPRPPFSATQTAQWNYANEVVAVRSYAEDGASQVVIDGADFDRVADLYGHVTIFSGEKGVLDPRQAEAGRLSGDVALVSHPYAADRPLVTPHA